MLTNKHPFFYVKLIISFHANYSIMSPIRIKTDKNYKSHKVTAAFSILKKSQLAGMKLYPLSWRRIAEFS